MDRWVEGIKQSWRKKRRIGITQIYFTTLSHFIATHYPPLGCAAMPGTNYFPIGCMIWQHAVILESICATGAIRSFFLGDLTGLFLQLALLFARFLVTFFLDNIIPNPKSHCHFTSLEKIFSKSNFGFLTLLLRKNQLEICLIRISSSLPQNSYKTK